jgi:pimeloyl-ACP methyl ester carboxylesterase
MIDYPWVRLAPWRRPQGRGLKEPEKDRDSWIAAVVDLRRAVDLLVARADVDPARIGYVGHSYGAQWGAILSAVDDRVRAAVLMAGAADSDAILAESEEPAIVEMREASSREVLERYLEINRPFDGIRYVPFAAPTPLLFQFARHERAQGPALVRHRPRPQRPEGALRPFGVARGEARPPPGAPDPGEEAALIRHPGLPRTALTPRGCGGSFARSRAAVSLRSSERPQVSSAQRGEAESP